MMLPLNQLDPNPLESVAQEINIPIEPTDPVTGAAQIADVGRQGEVGFDVLVLVGRLERVDLVLVVLALVDRLVLRIFAHRHPASALKDIRCATVAAARVAKGVE